MTDRTDSELGERVLVQSRRYQLIALITCVVIGAIGVALLLSRELVPSLIGLAVIALGVGFWQLLVRQSPMLWLDAEGFTCRRPGLGNQRESWAEVGPFSVYTNRGVRGVTFDAPGFAREHPIAASINRSSRTLSGTLPSGLGGLSPAELCALLNRYREAYRTSSRPAPGDRRS